jgi:hypothetical protein
MRTSRSQELSAYASEKNIKSRSSPPSIMTATSSAFLQSTSSGSKLRLLTNFHRLVIVKLTGASLLIAALAAMGVGPTVVPALYDLRSNPIVIAAYILKRPMCTAPTTWSRSGSREVVINSPLIILVRQFRPPFGLDLIGRLGPTSRTNEGFDQRHQRLLGCFSQRRQMLEDRPLPSQLEYAEVRIP